MDVQAAVAFEAGKPLAIVTGRVWNRGFDLMHKGESIRSVVVY